MGKLRATNQRVVVESVTPTVDDGRFPAKVSLGDPVEVHADVFADGHDEIAAVLRFRKGGKRSWDRVALTPLVNDRWRAEFTPEELGVWEFSVAGWVDHFASWRHGLAKKVDAEVVVDLDFLIGARLVEDAAGRAKGETAKKLSSSAAFLRDDTESSEERAAAGLADSLYEMMLAHPDRSNETTAGPWRIVVDRERAAFSTWYELFPRSWSLERGLHGTFKDVEKQLDYVAGMGFDVLYLPPIHPIGNTHRKGPNNTLEAGPDDPGVPWAIGSREGGHTAINPDLGTIEDFRRLRDAAAGQGVEIALDIAFQCSPDHPWASEHPEWFKQRPDGTIQYAEYPTQKYQDIYPIDFETSDPEGLWKALKGVFDHWIGEGIKVFRVDNPHTKSFPFWEWVIAEIRDEHPDVIMLAEAFTRPKVMHRLAKLGFNQSYTYFAWRNSRHELMEYMADLEEVSDFFRPNFWPNTPDILTSQLQTGGRAGFITRYVLAATLSSNCGIYGPAFELMEHEPLRAGSEEYLNSEKYEIREWEIDDAESLAPLIRQMNRARHDHEALQRNNGLAFHHTDNDMIIAYSKRSDRDVVLSVVNLDPRHTQSGWIQLDTSALGLDEDRQYQMHDLLTDRRYVWEGSRNFVQLDPVGIPAHVFWVREKVRTEESFDYFV